MSSAVPKPDPYLLIDSPKVVRDWNQVGGFYKDVGTPNL